MKKLILVVYQAFIFMPISIVATIVTAIIVMLGCTFGEQKTWGCIPPRYWSKLICRLALCRIKVVGREKLDPKASYIFIANHQSAFDIFLLYGYLGHNVKWVQKHTLRKLPFVGKASEMAGHVFVNQSSLKSMIETIEKTKAELEQGVSMVIFPEGSRGADGKMDRFRKGAFIISKQLALPIVPITLNGTFDVMKIHTYLISPSQLELIIHDPIPTDTITDEEIPCLIEKTHDTIHSQLWEKYK